MKKSAFFAVIIFALLLVMTLAGCNNIYKLSFKEESYIIEPEDTFSPEIRIFPKKKEYTLISSNPSIAKVTGNAVTAIKEGVVTLTVLSGDNVATTKLYVIKQDEYTGGVPLPAPEYVRISFLIEDYIFTSPMEIQKGMVPGYPYDLKRGGYQLDGWYIDKDCTVKYNFNQPINDNITVYGKWIMQEAQYLFRKIDDNTSYVRSLAYPLVPYTELTLPTIANDNTTVIGIDNGAFKDKATIEKVTIPDQYVHIGKQAFENCSKLKEVIINQQSQLKTIDNNAFFNCVDLTALSLPSTVDEIGAFAFAKCSKLNIGNLHTLTGLTVLNQYVFSETALTSVNLENIIEIKEGAFDKCAKLETVINAHNVTKCVKFAFRNTKAYSNSISQNNKVAYIDTILVGATIETFFTLDQNTTLIADSALTANSLAQLIVTVPSLPPLVGENAFHKDIIIVINELYYDDVRNVAPWEAYKSQLYTEYEQDGFTILRRKETSIQFKYTIRKYKGDAVHLDLNSLGFEIESIRAGAFTNNLAAQEDKLILKSLTIGKVASIHNFAITNIESLIAIIMTDTQSVPTLAGSMSISLGVALKIYVPTNLYMEYRTKWTSFRNIVYDSSIINQRLAIAVVPENTINYVVQYFGDDTTLIIPNFIDTAPITTILGHAFRYNTSIEHLVIGANITTIGFAAISNTRIKTIEFLNSTPPQIEGGFLNMNVGLQKIYVPAGSFDAYKTALPSAFTGVIEERE